MWMYWRWLLHFNSIFTNLRILSFYSSMTILAKIVKRRSAVLFVAIESFKLTFSTRLYLVIFLLADRL